MLRGSHSIFSAELDDDLIERYRRLDISSTGSLYGAGTDRLGAEPRSIEASIFAEHTDVTDCLDQQGTKLEMRALRAVAENLAYSYDAGAESLSLEMQLPAGCYVTTLLAHFMSPRDASQAVLR